MFIVVMSFALAGLFRSDGDRPIRLLAVNQDRGSLAASILRQPDQMRAFQVETIWEGTLPLPAGSWIPSWEPCRGCWSGAPTPL